MAGRQLVGGADASLLGLVACTPARRIGYALEDVPPLSGSRFAQMVLVVGPFATRGSASPATRAVSADIVADLTRATRARVAASVAVSALRDYEQLAFVTRRSASRQ